MEEPWEALDLDDSDLPSLLRPCKRLRDHRPNSISASATSSQPQFTSCSVSTQISGEQKEGENLPTLQESESIPLPPPRRIPGPAGIVQAAMIQKNFDRENHDFWSSQGADPILTQDYVKKAVADSSEFDHDFRSNPWLCALQFIRERPGTTTLRSITKCQLRVDKVVAVIKSSKPNGGLMVTLKDPTGTIGANIHPKVLSESNFGKNIIVGTVLVLKEVAVFAPKRSAVYLNITLRNVEKVFCKDSDYPPENAVKCSDPAGIDYSGRAEAVKNIFTAEKETTEELKDTVSQSMSAQGVVHCEIEMEKENLLPGIHTRQKKEPSNFSVGPAKGIEEIIRKVTTRDKQPEGSKPKNDSQAGNTTEQRFQETDKVVSKTQPFVSKPHLPEWTDEELSELFAGDGVDDFHGCNTTEAQKADEVTGKTQPIVSKNPLPEWTDEQLSELFAGDDMDG